MTRQGDGRNEEGGRQHGRFPLTRHPILLAFVLYSAFCVALVAHPPLVVALAEMASRTRWLAFPLLTLVGPGFIFIWGIEAWRDAAPSVLAAAVTSTRQPPSCAGR